MLSDKTSEIDNFNIFENIQFESESINATYTASDGRITFVSGGWWDINVSLNLEYTDWNIEYPSSSIVAEFYNDSDTLKQKISSSYFGGPVVIHTTNQNTSSIDPFQFNYNLISRPREDDYVKFYENNAPDKMPYDILVEYSRDHI